MACNTIDWGYELIIRTCKLGLNSNETLGLEIMN
jgi:hypothetical protein